MHTPKIIGHREKMSISLRIIDNITGRIRNSFSQAISYSMKRTQVRIPRKFSDGAQNTYASNNAFVLCICRRRVSITIKE